MNINKSVRIALTVAAIAGTSAVANAAQYNNFNGTTGTYGNNLVVANTGGNTFSNVFTITLARAGTLSADIATTAVNKATNINFGSVTITGPSFAVAKGYQFISGGASEYRALSAIDVAAGVYTILVSGTTGSTSSFSGSFAFAAVPEPATWALMIFGMGMTGVALRRRRNVTTKVSFA